MMRKSLYSVGVLLAVMTACFSCKVIDPPEVTVVPKEWTGTPGRVAFKATSKFYDKKAVCAGYNFILSSSIEPGIDHSYVSKDGKLVLDFTKVGNYEMSVTVADEFGDNVGSNGKDKKPFICKIVVVNPFETVQWHLNQKVIYAGKTLPLDAGAAKAASNTWQIFKPGEFSSLDADPEEEGYLPPIFRGATLDGVLYSDPITQVGKDYTLVHTATDSFGNSFSWVESFEVISQEEPAAAGFLFRMTDRTDPDTGAVTSEKEVCSLGQGNNDLTQLPKLYAGNTFLLDLTASQAGQAAPAGGSGAPVGGEGEEPEAEPLRFQRVWLDCYREGSFTERIEANASMEGFQTFSVSENRWILNPIVWTPQKEGFYTFKLTVTNELGKSKRASDNEAEDFHTVIAPNIPTVEFKGIELFGETNNYEGHKGAFKIAAQSPSAIGGKITEFTVHFSYQGKDLPSLHIEVPPETVEASVGGETVEYSTAQFEAGADWRFFHDPNGKATFDNYQIWVTCKNEQYESAEGTKYTLKIYDNDPVMVCKVNDMEGEVSLFWNDSTQAVISMEGTKTQDNRHQSKVELFRRGADGKATGDALMSNDGAAGLESFVYSKETAGSAFAFGASNTGEADFIARTTLTTEWVDPHTFTKEVIIHLTNEKTLSQFKVLSKKAGATRFFSNETVTVDFADSKFLDGTSCRQAVYDDLTLTVKHNGKAYDKFVSGSAQNGLIFKTPNKPHQLDVKVGLMGLYEFILQVGNGGNKDTSAKEINVINNLPDSLTVEQVEGVIVKSTEPNQTDENGIGTDAEGRFKLYKFRVTGAFPSGETLYKWYDTAPLPGVANLQSVLSVQPDEIVVKLRGNESAFYVVAQNVGGSSVAKAFPVHPEDLIPGLSPIVEAVEARTADDTPDIRITAADEADTTAYRFKVEGQADWFVVPPEQLTGVGKTATVTLPSQGVAAGQEKTVTVLAQARDSSPHQNWSDSASCQIVIDKKPPLPPVITTTYLGNKTNEMQPTLSWSADPNETEAVVGFRYRQVGEGVEWTETTESSAKMKRNGGGFPTGTYSFEVQDKDGAGNWSASATCQIIVDVTPPLPPVKGVYNEVTNQKRPMWVWKAGDEPTGSPDDATVGFRCQLGGEEGDWVLKDLNDVNFTPSADCDEGIQTLYVQARDSAGNWSGSVALALRIDLTPPDAPTALPVKSPTNADTVLYKWNPVSDAAEYKVMIKNGAGNIVLQESTVASSQYNFTAPDSTSYTCFIKAVDAAGNESAPTQVTAVVDRIAPAALAVTPTVPVRFGTVTQWNLSCDEAGVTYFYRVNDNSGYPNGWEQAENANPEITVPEGNVTLYVKAVDAAGNLSETASGSAVCGTPSASFSKTIAFASDVNNIGLPTQVQVGGVTVGVSGNLQSLTLVQQVDSRLVGTQSLKIAVTDKAANTVQLSCPITVQVPPAPVIPNASFEEDAGNIATHPHWHSKIYYGWKNAVGSWNSYELTGKWGSTDETGGTSSINVVRNDPALPPGGGHGIRFVGPTTKARCWYTNVGGKFTSELFPVYKGVKYKVHCDAYIKKYGEWGGYPARDIQIFLRIVKDPAESGQTAGVGTTSVAHYELICSTWGANGSGSVNAGQGGGWGTAAVFYTPAEDGSVQVQFDKTNTGVDKDHTDSPEFCFADFVVEVVDYPKAD